MVIVWNTIWAVATTIQCGTATRHLSTVPLSKVASSVDGLGNTNDNNKISDHVEGISLHMHEH